MSREKLRRAALPPVQKMYKSTSARETEGNLKNLMGEKVNSRKILMQFEQDQKETKDILLKCFRKSMKRPLLHLLKWRKER
ncbi:hypothetical protein ES332_D12G221500v1 [Gossypium tomentosum]|uniref:Uncharacterized protein n=1 Tax=Gossypium tomentosum TaxID=34277 RepID=A0A5D2IC89_GOSTO|nr:hypothetical protein ES332_D12G221500v1 [Gossypium tomentosum]